VKTSLGPITEVAGWGMEVKVNLSGLCFCWCTGSGVDTSRISLDESLACDVAMPSLRLTPFPRWAWPDSDDVVIGNVVEEGDLRGWW